MGFSDKTRAALATRLAGGEDGPKNTRELGEEKERLALDWLYRWGWAWPEILEEVGGSKSNRLAARLEKNKLITSIAPEAGGMRHIPRKLIVLTKFGLSEAERFQKVLLPYETDAYRIRQTHIKHHVFCQKATMSQIQEAKKNPDTNFEFKTERELAQKSQAEFKQPDIAWFLNKDRIAVEIELTAKWERDLDQFVSSTIKSLTTLKYTDGTVVNARFDLMFLFSDSPAIIERYRKCFKPGYVYYKWEKDQNEKWVKKSEHKVSESLNGKIQCIQF
jgi:hypothetical protein